MYIYSKTDIYINNKRTLTQAVNYKDIHIPRGTTWDGLSVPKLVAWAVPRWGEFNLASLVHDFLYSRASKHNNRKEADSIFYDILIELGVPKWKAISMYRSVRLFGSTYYKGR